MRSCPICPNLVALAGIVRVILTLSGDIEGIEVWGEGSTEIFVVKFQGVYIVLCVFVFWSNVWEQNVTMQSGLSEQYVQSLGQTASGLAFVFARPIVDCDNNLLQHWSQSIMHYTYNTDTALNLVQTKSHHNAHDICISQPLFRFLVFKVMTWD